MLAELCSTFGIKKIAIRHIYCKQSGSAKYMKKHFLRYVLIYKINLRIKPLQQVVLQTYLLTVFGFNNFAPFRLTCNQNIRLLVNLQTLLFELL